MKKWYFMVFAMVFAFTLATGLTEAQAGPDLVVSDLMVQNLTAAGVKIFITDVTKNQGTSKAAMTITNYFLSKSRTLDGTKILLGKVTERLVPELPANKTSIGSNYVLIPQSVQGGSWYVIAKADAFNYVVERVLVDDTVQNRDNNNIRAKGIVILEAPTPGQLPDLKVTAVNAPASANPGQIISVGDTTKNAGSSVAYKTLTSFYLSSDDEFGSGDVLIGGRIVASLGANESQSGATKVTIPVSASGTVYIIAVADSTSIMAESNESNNRKSSAAITISAP
jgi:subtilase family serine protease